MTAEGSVMLAAETDNLWRVYRQGQRQEVPALRGVNLRIGAGQLVALKGRSGSGKTTLLNCLGGLDQPTSGKVYIFQKDLSIMTEKDITLWRRKWIGFVYQSFALLPTLTAYENVELSLRIAGANQGYRHERTLHCLSLMGLDKWIHHRPYELSGGQQQRVAIARALANRPQLVLADEPTGELDSQTARTICETFHLITRQEHVTVIMASHDPLVVDYSDRVLEMEDGVVKDTSVKNSQGSH
ncbi:MAG: ABC transporter ATP-binding protein [Anaerolineales bacterium]